MYANRDYDAIFENGWVLDVVRDSFGGATIWLTGDGHFYEFVCPDATPLDLHAFGYAAQLVFDQEDSPYVIWARGHRETPFIWACAFGVAAWTKRIEDLRHA